MTQPTIDEKNISESELIQLRREKLAELREQKRAYPNTFKRKDLAAEIHQHNDQLSKQDLAETEKTVKVAGRIMMRRLMGKASFVQLQDMSGQIQLYLRKNDLAEDVYEDFKHWDIGDIIGAEGTLFKTNTGELSVHVNKVELLSKALRPLPDKFHGLTDHELCARQRYLDLIMNSETRTRFLMRTQIISAMRQFFIQRGFIEAETPMMQVMAGGATAKPFITHHNALDMPLYLRIAPELYLKRLVVGGFEKVFEINRNFRNEGLSTRHNPEFTMCEFYQAYSDYHDLLDLTEELMRFIANTVLGTTTFSYQGHAYDFAKPFTRMSLFDSILQFNPQIQASDLQDLTRCRAIAESLNITVQDNYGLGKLQTEIFEKTVEERLTQPTFITAYPTEVSPLARRNDHDPQVTDRFEFFVAGREVANGFSELNDPEDQAERFRQQVAEKAAGDEEAMAYDEDYIKALEYGMPPTAGEGIGIDRLVMLFTNATSIRDVILFPHMRPASKHE
jgi:lysyl-tRNA synthetase class 2